MRVVCFFFKAVLLVLLSPVDVLIVLLSPVDVLIVLLSPVRPAVARWTS